MLRDRSGSPEAIVQRILATVRSHLDVDIAFISEFVGGYRVFRFVDTALTDCPVHVGGADPREESYCHYVVRGDLPEFIPDARQEPAAQQLAVTHELPVGSHLSVPIRLSDGEIYGTFCCFTYEPDGSLRERDLAIMRLLADVVAGLVEDGHRSEVETRRRQAAIRRVIHGDGLSMVFQPVMRLWTSELVGVEALARFDGPGAPQQWFAEAWDVGLGVELELAAVRAALDQLVHVPDSAYLAFNVSPATAVDERFLATLEVASRQRLVVEVTEHAAVEDYNHLKAIVDDLADAGVRLAIDDVGMGVSGLNQIIQLAPDIIKIDAALVRGVGTNAAKQALISALIAFSSRMEVTTIAEGVETAEELDALRVLGVSHGQGYYLGRPADLRSACAPRANGNKHHATTHT